MGDDYYPGDIGFDPLDLKPTDPAEFAAMQTTWAKWKISNVGSNGNDSTRTDYSSNNWRNLVKLLLILCGVHIGVTTQAMQMFVKDRKFTFGLTWMYQILCWFLSAYVCNESSLRLENVHDNLSGYNSTVFLLKRKK